MSKVVGKRAPIHVGTKGQGEPQQETLAGIERSKYWDDDPLYTQIGGDHYKGFKIQPYVFFYENQLPYHKAAIIKRILRYDEETGGGLEDLQKIKHEVDLIMKLQYGVVG